jgi:hypothetical protein
LRWWTNTGYGLRAMPYLHWRTTAVLVSVEPALLVNAGDTTPV